MLQKPLQLKASLLFCIAAIARGEKKAIVAKNALQRGTENIFKPIAFKSKLNLSWNSLLNSSKGLRKNALLVIPISTAAGIMQAFPSSKMS